MHPFIYMALAPTFISLALSQSCSPISNIQLTYYGFPDGNSAQTSLDCSTGVASNQGGIAKGSGTYNDPFSFATLQGSTNFKECEKIYVPYLKKYFIYMDHCSGCDNNHIDLWVGSLNSGGAAQITCEQDLGTQHGQTVIKDPPSNLPVVAQNLWDGSCHNNAGSTLFPDSDASNLCSGGSGGGNPAPVSSSSPAPPPAIQTPPASVTVAPTPSPSNVAQQQPNSQPKPQGPPQVKQVEKSDVGQVKNNNNAPSNNQVNPAPPPPVVPPSSTPTTLATVTVTRDSKFGAVWSPPPIYQKTCQWLGHCIGDPCQSYDDCSGEWICIAGKCHDNLTD